MLEEILSTIKSDEIRKRIITEYEIIGSENIYTIKKIKQVLSDNFINYSISGSINSFYICYLLGIINFNPLRFKVDFANRFSLSINIPLKKKDKIFKLLSKKIKCLKKVSNTSAEDNLSFDGIVIDYQNKLNTYKTNIAKVKKKNLINKYFIINVYEKEILTILDKINFGNEEMKVFFSDFQNNKLLKQIDYTLKHQTAFENIIKNAKKFDLKYLIDNNICFNVNHLDQIFLEYKLTYYKYYQSRMYYITHLEYLRDLVDCKIIQKYQDDFSKYFKENKNELTYEYEFYSLWYDALKFLQDLKVVVKKEKVVIEYQNIIDMYFSSIQDKFSFINQIISENENKEIDVFGYEGDKEYYLNNTIANRLNISSFQVSSITNPLGGDKIFFNEEFYTKVSSQMILEAIDYMRNLPIFLHVNSSMEELLNCTNCGTEIIIIDDYESFANIDLQILKKLNKKIYLVHRANNKKVVKND